MAAQESPTLPTTASIENAMDKRAHRGRARRLPWILFLLLGIPFGLVAALTPLTMAGIYFEPLRRFWQPWPPDLLKPFIGLAVFCATLGYLAYRSGRSSGFYSGTVAATAAFRNIVEHRGPGAIQEDVPPPPVPQERALVVVERPVDSPVQPETEPPLPEESLEL